MLKTCIRSSDSHEPSEIGRRTTYVQLQELIYSELKSALEVPFRTRLEAPTVANSYIVGMHIRGSFYADEWLSLSPYSNAFIGVKGAGKTSMLECLRFALGTPVPESRRDSVENHLQRILGVSGTVSVLIKRSDGARLLVERNLNTPGFRVTFENDRQEMFASPDGFRFPTYILGWHEIEQAATDPKVRSIYLDTIGGREDLQRLTDAVEMSTAKIKYLHEDLAGKYSTFTALHKRISRLEEMRKGLNQLTDAKLIELKDQYERAVTHREALRAVHAALLEKSKLADARLSELNPAVDITLLQGASPIAEYAQSVLNLLTKLSEKLTNTSQAVRKTVDDVIPEVQPIVGLANEAFTKFQTDYQSRLESLTPEQRRLLESHQKVFEETKNLAALNSERNELRRQITASLDELIGLSEEVACKLDERTAQRIEKVEEMNTSLVPYKVHLQVQPMASMTNFGDLKQRFTFAATAFDALNESYSSGSRFHRRLASAYKGLKSDLIKGFHLFLEAPEFVNFITTFEDDDLKIGFQISKQKVSTFQLTSFQLDKDALPFFLCC